MRARVGMGEVRAVVQVDTLGSQLEDLALVGPRDDPVGRQEEAQPGVPPSAGTCQPRPGPCRDPRDRAVREDADQRALRGLEEAPADSRGVKRMGDSPSSPPI